MLLTQEQTAHLMGTSRRFGASVFPAEGHVVDSDTVRSTEPQPHSSATYLNGTFQMHSHVKCEGNPSPYFSLFSYTFKILHDATSQNSNPKRKKVYWDTNLCEESKEWKIKIMCWKSTLKEALPGYITLLQNMSSHLTVVSFDSQLWNMLTFKRRCSHCLRDVKVKKKIPSVH